MPYGLDYNDIIKIKQATYGEGAQATPEEMELIATTIINRLLSPRDREFGSTIPEILDKGYYAVINKNRPYREALNNEFTDSLSKEKWAIVNGIVNHLLSPSGMKEMGKSEFYFTPSEVEKQRKYGFKFNNVKPYGKVGRYEAFGY